MKRHGMEKGTISKAWSISTILMLILSSVLVSFIFRDDTQSAEAETPSTPIGTLTGSIDDRYFGWNVSSAGDINDDGYDDVIIGAPYSGAVVEAGDWWNDNWTYRRRLSFDNSDQNENLTNFPVLVNLNPANFDYAKANPDASDLRFIDADGSTELTYHIEEWNSLGDSYVWVNVTQVDGNSNSDHMWMYYNNSAASNSVDVWGTYDSEFVGVWHLNDSVGSVKDSTANGHNGAALGGVDRGFTGMVDGAYDFAGDDDYIDFGNDPQLMITGDITLEAWVNIDTDPATYDYAIMQLGNSGEAEADNWLYLLVLTPGGTGLDVDIGHEYGGGLDEKGTYDTNLQLDNWYYLVATRDVSLNEWRLFIDGVQFDTPFVYGNGPTGGGNGNLMVCMDWYNSAWRFTDGTMDELRISTIPRSADWISAQYLSMTDNFIAFGYEEKRNGTCGAAYIFFGGPGILGDITTQDADIIINGSAANDRFGWSVVSGDVLGDNTTDILVGVPGYNGGQGIGAVYIFDGDTLVADADGRLVASEATTIITGENPGDEFGRSIALTDRVSGSDWWNTEWGLRKKLTFLNSGQSETLTNFPILVTLTTSNFNYTNAKSDGTDLRFIDSDGATELNYHIEEWNPSGSSFVWVNVTQIEGSSNSDFMWVYYNNSAATNVQDLGGTYDNDFMGVWHLNESSGGAYAIKDSTSYNNDGTDANNPTLGAAGKIGNAVDFSGVDDYINVNDSASLDISGTGITISAWIAPDFDNTEGTRRVILDKRGSPANDAYRITYHDLTGDWRLRLTHGATSTSLNTPDITWNIDDWHYFVSTYNGNDIKLFWDGVEVISTPATGSISTTDFDMGIGAIASNTNTIFDGTIDEVRLSNIARTADWISAQYLSMNNSFISFGPEEIPVGEEHDIIVGAPEYGASKGRAYIFFGDGSIPTNALDADVFLAGSADNSGFGYSVSCAGDMNGDGNCDIIVGAPGENRAYIYFGGPDMTTSRLSRPLIQGAQDDTGSNIDDLKLDDDSYYQVAKNGKIMFIDLFNTTGLAGIVTGATLYVQYFTQNNYDTNDNITWALNGQPQQDTDIEITQSSAEVTPPGYDLFAQGVDTLEELETLDISFTNTASGGQVNVFFDYVWIEVTTNAAVPMVILNGSGDFGWSVSGNGDMNGDGLGDVVIGAPDLSGTSPGQVRIKKGNLQGFDNETTGANPVGWTQYGTYAAVINDTTFFGSSGKSMELNDIGGGLDNVETRKTFSSASNGVIEFYARTSVTTTENLMIDISRGDPGIISNMGAWIYFTDNNDIRCMIGDGAGGNVPVVLQKYNVDTWYHIRVVFDSTTDTYSVWVDGKLKMGNGNFMLDNDFDYIDTLNIRTNFGGTNQAFIDEATVLTSNIGNTIIGESNGDQFGYSVSNVGNLNGDIYDDIIVGAPGANGNGSVYIFHGNDSWNPVISFSEANNTLIGEYVKDGFGWSISYAGDVNNDDQNNFIVGAPFYDDGANTDAGKAYIFFGPNVTYRPDLWINGSLDNVYQVAPSGAQIDISLISAGDNSTWWIVLQNDGSENDTFDFGIAATMLPGWSWEMIENGTKNKANDGDFISLAPGEMRNYTLNISSSITAAPLDESSVEVGVRSQNGSTYDSVKAIARIAGDLPPEIFDVQAAPDPQETGGSVNITCNVTDDINVSSVWVNITLPGGGFNNFSMVHGSGDRWFYKNAYIVLGLYQYTIWANDTSGNWNSSSGHGFTIQDTSLPVISNVLDVPDSQETGDFVNISCDVIDDIGVSGVWVNITLPGGGYSNVSMSSGAGDQWFLNTTYVPLGLYQYTIWANDTSNNWNSSSGHSFTIQDTTLPVISNVLDIPDPQEMNAWVNISCDVTDNVAVDTVWVNITLPGGGYSNVSMTPGAADQRFYNNTFPTLGLYQYTIWANDTTGNWNSSSDHSFTIQDTSLPVISSVLDVPDPQDTGGYINISCDVTDNVGVGTVWVNITLPGGGYSNISMDKGAVDQWFYNNTFATIGLYQYSIWANDTSGNWNSSSGHSFTFQDTSFPVISNVLDIPDPQETGGSVNISCDVTDAIGVSTVWVNISLPGGGFTNISMDQGAADQWFYNNTFAAVGLYQYTIWANDTTGNWNRSSGHSFTIQDTSLPVISNVLDFPDPQETGGFVNISCDVTDNVGVDTVWVNITLPGGGYNNISMDQGAGNQWFYNSTFAPLGLYQYVIWTNDTSGNWNSSSGYGFTIQDTTLPVISNVLDVPDPQETGGFINISCDVTDNVGVGNVQVNISLPGGGYSNVSMNPGAGNQWFFNNTFVPLGLYQYTIWVNDTSGNWNSSAGQFVIQDTTLPSITDVTAVPNPQELNGLVNISAIVTDAVGVFGAWVEVVDPLGGFVGNFSMTYDSVTGRYYVNQTYGILGVYQYVIWANDTDGNWVDSSGHTFTIEDITLPIIKNVMDAPDPQEVDGWVNITCDVSDNDAVGEVWVNISLPGGGFTNTSMAQGAGSQWFTNSTFPGLGPYQYTIWVNDTSGNLNSSTGHGFTMQDTEIPEISNVLDVPDPQETGSSVNISCDVTDNVGVQDVWVNITLPGGGYSNVSMDPGAGSQWFLNDTYAFLGSYQYTIWTNDTAGNWNSSTGHDFTIQDIELPEIINVLDGPDPQATGEYVNISCDITDNYAIDNVWVNITLPGGGYSNVSMTQGTGNQWFLNNTYPLEGSYQYTIWASDTTGNWNSSSGHGFITLDSEPLLTDPGVLPIMGYEDTLFNFTVNYSHSFNRAPSTITLNLTGPSGGIFSLMEVDPADTDYTDGKLYYLTTTGLTIGSYSFHFAASDIDGKCVETGVLGFDLINRMPSLSLPQLNPVTGYTDTGFNFTVIYTDPDNHPPDTITVNITGFGIYDLFEADLLDTDFTDGKVYYVNITGIPIGSSYTFHFAANDSMGYWALETPEIDAPEIQLRTATLTSFAKTVKFSDDVVLNATLMESGNPVEGVDVAFYIDINKNGINEPGEYIGTVQTLSDGTASLDYTAMLALGFYPYISSYQGSVYVVSNSTEIIFIDPKPAVITTNDKTIEEGQSVTLNATLEDEDGNGLYLQTIEFLVDRNQNTIFEGGEVVGSGDTDTNGYVEVTYTSTLSSSTYGIWAKYKGSGNYSVTEDYAVLSVQNIGNNPPIIVTPVPHQIKLEDSLPWELVLTPFELDMEDTGENLKWYLTGVDSSLYTVIGMNMSDDTFTFIPVDDAYGNNEVTLWLVDSSGGTASQTLWVNITPVNDRPRIESINPITVHFDAEYTYLFFNYVSDIEDPREDLVLSTDDPEHTTVNGLSITFLYPKSMNGTTQNVLVTVTDTDGGSTSTIVIIRVTDDWVPELETEIPDITLYEGETVTNRFDLDDYFTDPDGDALFYVTGQSHVKIDINPITHVVNITAPTDWSGTEIVNFHAIDPSQARVEDIVLITVLPVNDVPSIVGVPDLVVRFDQDYKFDLTPYISDEDNNASELILSFIDPDTGLLIPGISIDPNDNLEIIINFPESMNGSIIRAQIWVSDGYDSNFTTVNITVSDDFPPELIMPIPDISFEEDTALISAFNIRSFFIDIDDVYLIYTSGHDNINVTINPDGSVDFSAPANWSGSEQVTFRATDGPGALVESTITVSVIPVNDAPTIAQIPNQVGEPGRIWVLDISKYLFDIDNDIRDLVVSVDSEYVRVVGYTLIFDYPMGIEEDIVTVIVSDGALNSSESLSVTVTKDETPSSGPLLLDYIFWILLIPIILAALLIGFTAIKRKVTAPFVEEVFLIADDGVLIAHNSLSLEEEIDIDILSGMLTGVKNLISDAFAKEEGRQKGLHKLEFGEKNIMLEKADHFFIALVFSGVENKQLFKKIQKVINELEEKYGEVLKTWTGDMEVFVDTDEILEPLLSLEELSKEEREQLKEARKRLKEAKELAIRELDIHLVNLLSEEEMGESEDSLPTENDTEHGVE